jgi:uncharacterized membrane protein YfcA
VPVTIVIVAATVLFASFSMGLTGFGFGLVAMGIFPFLMTVADANALVLMLAGVVCIAGVTPLIRQVRWDVLWPVLIGSAVGVPLGILYLVELNESILRISLGVVILSALAGTEYLSRRTQKPGRPAPERSGKRRAVGAALGVFSGGFGAAFSVGGPPIVLFLNNHLSDKTQIKATLLMFFIFNMTFRAPLLAAAGVITTETLMLSLWSLPTLAVGLVSGSLLHTRLDSGVVRRLIQVLLVVSASMLIIRAF